MILDEEDIVELIVTFKDADGEDKAHTIHFTVEPDYLWSSFTTDYRLKMIQAYSEFTSRMVAEAIDDYVKRVRRATLSAIQTTARLSADTPEGSRPSFNEAVYACKEFTWLPEGAGCD